MIPKLVLFDLDDTLVDHQYACRATLLRMREEIPELQRLSCSELENEYHIISANTYRQIMEGVLDVGKARAVRMQRLIQCCGKGLSLKEAAAIGERFRVTYQSCRVPVHGAVELLLALKVNTTIGVVTNNFVKEQRSKLEHCGMTQLIDYMVTSEEVGCLKPDERIFLAALRDVDAGDALMIGDNWEADILGATRLGIRAIWLNRSGAICPDPHLCPTITNLAQCSELMNLTASGIST